MKECKLTILDEVNVKIDNLAVDARRRLVNEFKYEIPYAKHTPQYKLGRWDGTKGFFGLGGNGFINHLDRILPILEEYDYAVTEIEDLRHKYDIKFEPIQEDFWGDTTWPKGHVFEGQPIRLKDYQVSAVNTYLENLQSLQCISTGAGKCQTYDSCLKIEIDNDIFSNSVIDKFTEEDNIQIGQLAEAVEKFKDIKLYDNCEVDIRDLGCKINTPSGLTQINQIIKKENLQGLKITLENGTEIKCAKKHILRNNNNDVFAESLFINDAIETIDGDISITNIEDIDDTTFYDIGIDYPHLYYDANGVLHHNTILTATLSKIIEPYGRSIIIVPNKTLVEQTEEDYINVGLNVGVYFGDRKELGKTHTICTWQSLNILGKKQQTEESYTLSEFLDGVSTVIVDECHTASADVLTKLLNSNFKNTPIRWGMTGTIPKEDHTFQSLLTSIGPVVGTVTAYELQEKGVLSKCDVNVLQLVDIVAHRNYHDELKYLVTTEPRVEFIANKIKEISESGNTLVLVDRIATGEMLHKFIEGSTFVKGDVKSRDRKTAFKDINEATNNICIATYGVASTGINIPRIFNLVMIESGKSFVRVIQSIGRGIRKSKDKDYVQIWDISSTCKYSKRHLSERKKYYKQARYPYNVQKVDWQ